MRWSIEILKHNADDCNDDLDHVRWRRKKNMMKKENVKNYTSQIDLISEKEVEEQGEHLNCIQIAYPRNFYPKIPAFPYHKLIFRSMNFRFICLFSLGCTFDGHNVAWLGRLIFLSSLPLSCYFQTKYWYNRTHQSHSICLLEFCPIYLFHTGQTVGFFIIWETEWRKTQNTKTNSTNR